MHQPVDKEYFVIMKDYNDKSWYLYDKDVKDTGANKWTRDPDNALTFDTKREADEVVRGYDIKDVYIDTITVTE